MGIQRSKLFTDQRPNSPATGTPGSWRCRPSLSPKLGFPTGGELQPITRPLPPWLLYARTPDSHGQVPVLRNRPLPRRSLLGARQIFPAWLSVQDSRPAATRNQSYQRNTFEICQTGAVANQARGMSTTPVRTERVSRHMPAFFSNQFTTYGCTARVLSLIWP